MNSNTLMVAFGIGLSLGSFVVQITKMSRNKKETANKNHPQEPKKTEENSNEDGAEETVSQPTVMSSLEQ